MIVPPIHFPYTPFYSLMARPEGIYLHRLCATFVIGVILINRVESFAPRVVVRIGGRPSSLRSSDLSSASAYTLFRLTRQESIRPVPCLYNHAFRRPLSAWNLHLVASDDYLHNESPSTTNNENSSQDDSLTPARVPEMIEVSFINACLQLARGYVDVLKLFIVAVKAGYELDMSPQQLNAAINALPDTTRSAGRELMPEEVVLRQTWIEVVYLALEYLGYDSDKENHSSGSKESSWEVDEAVRDTYSRAILSELHEQHERGADFPVNDAFLEKCVSSSSSLESPMEKAILSQSLRVIWLTYTVLREEQVCLNERSGLKAQPPIPGALE